VIDLHCHILPGIDDGAGSLATALAMARSDVPDLITLDLLLPDASGLAVLDEIKSNPRLESVPVVIVSIVAEEMKACVPGVAQVLQKPVLYQSLHDAVYALGLGKDHALAPTVVIIDDAASCARLSSDLAALNYKVQCYADGASALAAMAEDRPDLLIIGLALSDPGAVEAIAALRQQAAADVPILVLSEGGISEEARQRLSGQVLRIMEKDSFNRRQFLFEVGRALQRHSAGLPS